MSLISAFLSICGTSLSIILSQARKSCYKTKKKKKKKKNKTKKKKKKKKNKTNKKKTMHPGKSKIFSLLIHSEMWEKG